MQAYLEGVRLGDVLRLSLILILLFVITAGCIGEPEQIQNTSPKESTLPPFEAVFGGGGVISPTTQPPITTLTPTTIQSTNTSSTTKIPIDHVDVSQGGIYETGDYVEFLGEKGVLTGNISDGEVSSSELLLTDEEGQTRLYYQRMDHPTYGQLDLISYPEEGEVYLEIDGVDSGYVFKYVSWVDYDHYLSLYQYPNYPEVQQFILEKP